MVVLRIYSQAICQGNWMVIVSVVDDWRLHLETKNLNFWCLCPIFPKKARQFDRQFLTTSDGLPCKKLLINKKQTPKSSTKYTFNKFLANITSYT